MVTIERSYNSIAAIPLDAHLLEKGHIFLKGEIDSATADDFKKQVMFLVTRSDSAPIVVHVDSPGGEITAGLAIYDIIQAYADRIYVVCTGQACSMGAVIFAGGGKGRRFMLAHSELMLHEPLLGNRVGGNCSSLRATSDRLLTAKDKINEILAHHTEKPKEEIDKATAYDHFYTADEAIAFGLCDGIISFDRVMRGEWT